MIRAILALILFATQAHSETIVLGLSQRFRVHHRHL